MVVMEPAYELGGEGAEVLVEVIRIGERRGSKQDSGCLDRHVNMLGQHTLAARHVDIDDLARAQIGLELADMHGVTLPIVVTRGVGVGTDMHRGRDG
jgi:hypothetical protein